MRIHEEVRKMPLSPIRAWTQRLHDLGPRAELTLGEPAQSTDPRIGEAAAAALRQGLTHYPPAAGLKSLRELLAEREKAQRGWRFCPEQILITDGAQEALAVCCLGLLNPGDEVLVTDIFAAREKDPGDIHATMLVKAMQAEGVPAHYTPTFDDAEAYLRAHWQPGDLVITMSCGNINLLNAQIQKHGD